MERSVPTDISAFEKQYKITAVLNSNWMMGGIAGRFKDSNQFLVGGLYWNSSFGDSLACLIVSGMDYLDVTVNQTSFTIIQTSRTAQIVFYIHCENVTLEMISQSIWMVPGLNLEIMGDSARISAELCNKTEFNKKFSFNPTQTVIKITSDLESLTIRPCFNP